MQTIEQSKNTGVLDIRPGDSLLAAVAHPDDELMLGGVLAEARKIGANLLAVIATNGEASERGDRTFVAAGRRWLEGSKALSAYGISREHQFFLGLPDGQLARPAISGELGDTIRDIAIRYGVSTVVTLGTQGFDDHLDHQAVHTAAVQSLANPTSLHPDISLFGLTNSTAERYVTADPRLKLQNLAHHASQFTVDSVVGYAPEPGTVELPGLRLSEQTRQSLEPYWLNLQMEGYNQYPLRAATQANSTL